MKLKENAMQILQDCLHSNEMLAIYLLEFGTDMPSNITKKDLISIIFKISRRKDLISVIMFLCQKLDWIATKEDGVLTKEIQESDKKLEENTSEENGLDASKISPDKSFTTIKSGQCSSKILAKDHETENYQQSLATKINGTISSFNQNSPANTTRPTNQKVALQSRFLLLLEKEVSGQELGKNWQNFYFAAEPNRSN